MYFCQNSTSHWVSFSSSWGRSARCECSAVSLQPAGRPNSVQGLLQRSKEVHRNSFGLSQSRTVSGLLPAICPHVPGTGVQQSWKWGQDLLWKVSPFNLLYSHIWTPGFILNISMTSSHAFLSISGSAGTRSATMKMTCVFYPAWQRRSTWEAMRPCWTSGPASLSCVSPVTHISCSRGTCRSVRTTRFGILSKSISTLTSSMACHAARARLMPCLAAWQERESERPIRLRLDKCNTDITWSLSSMLPYNLLTTLLKQWRVLLPM